MEGRNKYVHQQAIETISVKADYQQGNYNIARIAKLYRMLVQDTKGDGPKC